MTKTAPHDVPDVASYYSLAHIDIARTFCQGTACFAARGRDPDRFSRAVNQSPRVYCLGKCFQGPACGADGGRPRIEVRSRESVVLPRIATGGVRSLTEYRQAGGLSGLERALSLGRAGTLAEIAAAELRGRGGAGFPTAVKWRAAAEQPAGEKHVVANLDEGDPGAYIDRFIAEDDPFALLEGLSITAWTIGATRGWIYVRCEYPAAIAQIRAAVAEARESGWLGSRLLGRGGPFDIEIVVGGGSYECGEETALVNSLEGRRPMARIRPPYLAERGLWGRPTVVNNVETLVNVAWIAAHGAPRYTALGAPGSRGTKVVSLNSLFRRPGLYEVEFGVTVRDIVEEFGGGLRDGAPWGVMIGGPLAGVIPPRSFDTRFTFDDLRSIGGSVGHGGVIAFDDTTSVANLVRHVFSFGAYESCGACTPCRLGAPRIEAMFAPREKGARSPATSRTEYEDLVAVLKHASLCGLGTGLAEFAESIQRNFGQELAACFA